MGKNPAFQFYPADWKKDSALRGCSLSARGLWIDMICHMHESKIYGHFLAGDVPPTEEEAARIIGCKVKEYRSNLAELKKHGVFCLTENGVIFSKRMVNDQAQRENWKNRKNKSRNEKKQQDIEKCHADVPSYVTPMSHVSSSSSSSSSSTSSKDILSGKPDDVSAKEKEKIPYQEIVDFLNEKTGGRYRVTSKDTHEHIKARWKEGATLEDFKRAISKMTFLWKDDPKMSQYLRPKTLFSKDKFEGYVNRIITELEKDKKGGML